MKENQPGNAKKGEALPPRESLIRLGAFGKHPGWNDFMDHVGAESPLMARAKREFFLGAIRTLVDAKRWQGLSGDTGLMSREWHWLWQEKNEFLIGLLWPSQDGILPARKFPMTLAAHCRDVDLAWACKQLFPILSRAAKELRALKTEAEVLACIQEAQKQCDEALVGVPPEALPDYPARAGRFVKESWLTDNPEALPRILYFIHTRLPDLAIAARDLARKKKEEFEAVRLPCPVDSPPAAAAGWLAFLRSQIDNEAPILWVHPAGAGWCDVLFGGVSPDSRLSLDNTLRLQQDSAVVPLITQAYNLDAEFLDQAGQTLAAIPLDWGNPAKRTIFGPVPVKYRPGLPGEKITNVGRKLADLVAKPRRESAGGGAAGGAEDRGSLKRVALIAGGVLAVGVLILLASLFFRSSAPKPPDLKISQDEGQSLQRDWTSYVQDYTNWFNMFVRNGGGPAGSSLFLTTNLTATLAGARVPDFAPLAIYGSADSLNLTEPDPKELKARQEMLLRAYQARDQVRSLLQERFPAKVTADLHEMAGTPLEPATRSLLLKPRPAALSQQAAFWAALEAAAAQLRSDWNGLKDLQELGTRFDSNNLARLLVEQDRGLAAVTNLAEVNDRLGALRTNQQAALDWLKLGWSGIDQVGLSAELAGTNLSSLQAWTNLASNYVKIFTDQDPRTTLGDRLEQIRTNQWHDLVLAASDGNPSATAALAGLTNQFGRLNSQFRELKNSVAIRKNQVRLSEQIAQAGDAARAFAGEVQTAWTKVFDFDELLKQQRTTACANPTAARLWTNYLNRVEQLVRSKPQRLSGEALIEWRKKLEQARAFFDCLGQIPPATIAFPLLARPDLADLVDSVFSDYCAGLANLNLGPDLGVLETCDAFLTNQTKVGWDRSATNFTATLAGLLGDLSGIARGKIPDNLDGFRNQYRSLKAPAGFATGNLPQMVMLQNWNSSIWDSPATPSAIAADLQHNPPPDFSHLAMWLARLNENSGWPHNVSDWQSVMNVVAAAHRQIAQMLPPLDPSAASQSLAFWLKRQWEKMGLQVLTFGDIEACVNQATAAGLAMGDLPRNLTDNYQLAELIKSFDGNNIVAFQGQAREFLKGQVPEVQQKILSQILNLPADGTGWRELAPAQLKIPIQHPAGGDALLVRDGVTNRFKLLEVGNHRLFVSVSEFSCQAFIQLANLNLSQFGVKWITDLKATLPDAADPFYTDPVNYLNNLEPRIAGGHLTSIQLRNPRTEGLSGDLAASPILKQFGRLTAAQPVNFVSPELASQITKAWGCRWLTPAEWNLIQATHASKAPSVIWSQQLQSFYQALEKGVPTPQALPKLFFGKIPTLPAAAQASAPASGGDSLFAEVDDPHYEAGGLIHWYGNVAEYLWDGSQYYVAGGSWISQSNDGITDPQPVPNDQTARAWADVGFRLVFDWVGVKPADQIRELLSQLQPASARVTAPVRPLQNQTPPP